MEFSVIRYRFLISHKKNIHINKHYDHNQLPHTSFVNAEHKVDIKVLQLLDGYSRKVNRVEGAVAADQAGRGDKA